MKVLLTGATGYLGSRLATGMVEGGHRVVVLKRSSSDLTKLENLSNNLSFHKFDCEDLASVFRVEEPIDVVVHAATCYGHHGESPGQILQVNSLLPLQLLGAAQSAGVRTFINVDSSLPSGVSPYALSKHQFSEWGRLLAGKKTICFVNATLEHFYGPGDDAARFATHVIRTCLRNLPEIPLTSGEQLRDFIHITDAVKALLLILDKSRTWSNGYVDVPIGSGKAVTVRYFAEMVHRLTGSRTKLLFSALPYRMNEPMVSVADLEMLHHLGWNPEHSLEEGLNSVITAEKKGEFC